MSAYYWCFFRLRRRHYYFFTICFRYFAIISRCHFSLPLRDDTLFSFVIMPPGWCLPAPSFDYHFHWCAITPCRCLRLRSMPFFDWCHFMLIRFRHRHYVMMLPIIDILPLFHYYACWCWLLIFFRWLFLDYWAFIAMLDFHCHADVSPYFHYFIVAPLRHYYVDYFTPIFHLLFYFHAIMLSMPLSYLIIFWWLLMPILLPMLFAAIDALRVTLSIIEPRRRFSTLPIATLMMLLMMLRYAAFDSRHWCRALSLIRRCCFWLLHFFTPFMLTLSSTLLLRLLIITPFTLPPCRACRYAMDAAAPLFCLLTPPMFAPRRAATMMLRHYAADAIYTISIIDMIRLSAASPCLRCWLRYAFDAAQLFLHAFRW